MKNYFMTILTLLLIVSCSKGGDERLAEKESIKSREQVEAENENQREWAEKMEKDLNQRKHFIQAVEGKFEGDLTVSGIDFNITANMISSIPINFSDRVRTLDEINYELENLTLTVNVKMENPRIPNSGVSCTIEGHRPDIKNGIIKMISDSCKNIFRLSLSDTLKRLSAAQIKRKSKVLAKEVIENRLDQIDILDGIFESSTSTQEYKFKLKRI